MTKREEYMNRHGLIGCCEWCGDWVRRVFRGEMYCGLRCWQRDNPAPAPTPEPEVPSLASLMREFADEYGDNPMPEQDAIRAANDPFAG